MEALILFVLSRVYAFYVFPPESDFALYLFSIRDSWEPKVFGYRVYYKPLLYFWFLKFFNTLFGFLPGFLRFRMSTLFFAFGNFVAFTAAVQKKWGKGLASIASFLYAINPVFIILEFSSFPDLFGSACVWAALVFPFPISAFFFVASMLFKPLPGVFLPLLMWIWGRKKEAVLYTILIPFLLNPSVFWTGFKSLFSHSMISFMSHRATAEHLGGRPEISLFVFGVLSLLYIPLMIQKRPPLEFLIPWIAFALLLGWFPNFIWYLQPLFPALTLWPALGGTTSEWFRVYKVFLYFILMLTALALFQVYWEFWDMVDILKNHSLYVPGYEPIFFFTYAYYNAPSFLCYGVPAEDSSPVPFSNRPLYKKCEKPAEYVLGTGKNCERFMTFVICQNASLHS